MLGAWDSGPITYFSHYHLNTKKTTNFAENATCLGLNGIRALVANPRVVQQKIL